MTGRTEFFLYPVLHVYASYGDSTTLETSASISSLLRFFPVVVVVFLCLLSEALAQVKVLQKTCHLLQAEGGKKYRKGAEAAC